MGCLVIALVAAIVVLVSGDEPHDTQYQTDYYYNPTGGRTGYDYQRYDYPGNYYNSGSYPRHDYDTYPTAAPPSYPANYPPNYPPRYPPNYPPRYPPRYPPTEPPRYPALEPPSYPPSEPPSYPPREPPSYPPSEPPSYPPSDPPSYPPSEPSYPSHGYRNPCKGYENEGKTFPVAGVCFAFFECHREESLYRHCDDNYRFDYAAGECVYDEYCHTACPYHIRGNPNNDHTFYLGNSLMNCPYGTYFDYKICACQHNYLRPSRPYLPYDPED